jgi:competence protein ComEA
VRLAVGARVADAVAAAGGVTRRRAADSVNLARLVVDGEQIVVDASIPATSRPPQGPQGAPPSGQDSSGAPAARPGGTGSAGSSMDGTVGAPLALDLNLADAAALESLPGVGPVLAGRIVQWRAENGPFTSVEELGEVSGIGEATLGRLRPLVRV